MRVPAALHCLEPVILAIAWTPVGEDGARTVMPWAAKNARAPPPKPRQRWRLPGLRGSLSRVGDPGVVVDREVHAPVADAAARRPCGASPSRTWLHQISTHTRGGLWVAMARRGAQVWRRAGATTGTDTVVVGDQRKARGAYTKTWRQRLVVVTPARACLRDSEVALGR